MHGSGLGARIHCDLWGVHQADEGAVAHMWQLLMGVQIPIIAFFIIRYVPQKPQQVLLVLVLKLTAALYACAPVFSFFARGVI